MPAESRQTSANSHWLPFQTNANHYELCYNLEEKIWKDTPEFFWLSYFHLGVHSGKEFVKGVNRK